MTILEPRDYVGDNEEVELPEVPPLTTEQRIDVMSHQVDLMAQQVNWLCVQLQGIMSAAQTMPGIGGMLLKKGLGG